MTLMLHTIDSTSTPQACVHPHSPGECGWLWTEPVSYSKCSKWRPLAFPHARSHPHSPFCGVLKRHNFRVHVSLGSAETLVRRGGIINHHSIAYSLSNISAKNYRNRLMWVESIVSSIVSVSFFETQCTLPYCAIYYCAHLKTHILFTR